VRCRTRRRTSGRGNSPSRTRGRRARARHRTRRRTSGRPGFPPNTVGRSSWGEGYRRRRGTEKARKPPAPSEPRQHAGTPTGTGPQAQLLRPVQRPQHRAPDSGPVWQQAATASRRTPGAPPARARRSLTTRQQPGCQPPPATVGDPYPGDLRRPSARPGPFTAERIVGNLFRSSLGAWGSGILGR